MNFREKIIIIFISSFLYSCADYKIKNDNVERKYFSSSGFALIYQENYFKDKVINKKINNDNIVVYHNVLKKNTPIKIINPINEKFVETKVSNNASFPKIFSVVISKKIATILEIDISNPFVEILEVKRNKTFVAKKSNTFDEEKNVAEKAPVSKVKVKVLSLTEDNNKKKINKNSNFIIIISDFYYQDSADNLKKMLIEKTQSKKISVKKVNNTKYRLFAGPFENFNALKNIYISLNNLGFENLNIIKN